MYSIRKAEEVLLSSHLTKALVFNPAAHVYERDYILSHCLCANGLFYHTLHWNMISPVMSCGDKDITSVGASGGGGEEEKENPFFQQT